MILHVAALAAVAACVRASVRRYFDYEEPDDHETPDSPPELDAAQLGEALDALADRRGLKWKTSIVDLLKTVDAPARFVERDALWRGCGKTDVYRGTPAQNNELHKLVMEKLRVGGIPMPVDP